MGQGDAEAVAALADVCRAKGIARLCVSGIEIVMGPAVAAAPSVLTDEEREKAEHAGRLAARRLKLRSILGRPPTDAELEGPEALP